MQFDPDFILWLNDDSLMQPDTVAVMVRTHDDRTKQGNAAVIIVAALSDPVSGELSYGGVRRTSSFWRPWALELAGGSDQPVHCDSMNGNCVLLPRAAWRRLGNLDEGFVHGLGDFDYGLRATAMSISVWQAPGILGQCSRNSDKGSFKDGALPLADRWRCLTGAKGLPMRAWAIYTQRHGGLLWLFGWLWPYIHVVLVGLYKRAESP